MLRGSSPRHTRLPAWDVDDCSTGSSSGRGGPGESSSAPRVAGGGDNDTGNNSSSNDGAAHGVGGVELQAIRAGGVDASASETADGTPLLQQDDAEAALASPPSPSGQASSSVLQVAYNLSNSVVGAGIIGLPYALSQAGPGLGLVLLLAMAMVTDATIAWLVAAGKLIGKTSYQDVIGHHLGRHGRVIVASVMICFGFGAMIGYLVIVGDVLPPLLALVFGPDSLAASRAVITVVCAVFVILPISSVRAITHLARFSFTSMCLIAFVILTAMLCCFVLLATADPSAAQPPDAWRFAQPRWLPAIGVISFSYVCHHNVGVLLAELRRPTMARFAVATHLSMATAFLLSIALSLTGYATFFTGTKANFLSNFPASDPAINLARFAFAITMCLTYPLELFVCRQALATVCFGISSGRLSHRQHYGLTLALLVSTLVLALLAGDNLSFVLELTGGFAAVLLSYVLPPLCYLASIRAAQPWYQRAQHPAALVVVFGCITSVASIVTSLSSASSSS